MDGEQNQINRAFIVSSSWHKHPMLLLQMRTLVPIVQLPTNGWYIVCWAHFWKDQKVQTKVN